MEKTKTTKYVLLLCYKKQTKKTKNQKLLKRKKKHTTKMEHKTGGRENQKTKQTQMRKEKRQ